MQIRPTMPPQTRPAIRPYQASNITNSTDPAAKHCRVFVGNLNTVAMSKEDVEQIFGQYGMVAGCSMHKGYAFIQYNTQVEAHRAAQSEDGKVYHAMKIDANVASQPKKGVAIKREGAGIPTFSPRTSMAASGGFRSQFIRPNMPMIRGPRLLGPRPVMRPSMVNQADGGPPIKRGRIEPAVTPMIAPIKRTIVTLTGPYTNNVANKQPLSNPAIKLTTGVFTGTVPTADVLICGKCKIIFHSITSLTEHKKSGCTLKFSCKCEHLAAMPLTSHRPAVLTCATCKQTFGNGWDLCHHCQTEHGIDIYSEAEADVKVEEEEEEEQHVLEEEENELLDEISVKHE